jgi:hypothetical protein
MSTVKKPPYANFERLAIKNIISIAKKSVMIGTTNAILYLLDFKK